MLSILIPAFNAEKYIGAAIDSAAAQTVDGGTEILVCDDGSTDATAAIVREKMNHIRGLKVFRLGVNQGVSAARNRLIGEVDMQAGFVTFLDADDVLVDQAYQPGLKILRDAPDVQMTFGRMRVVPTHDLDDGKSLLTQYPLLPGVSLSTGVFRSAVIRRVGLFDLSFSHGEDIDYLLRIKEICADIVTHDDLVLYYRRHTANATSNHTAMKRGFMRALLLHAKRRKADPCLMSGEGMFRLVEPAVLEKVFKLYGT